MAASTYDQLNNNSAMPSVTTRRTSINALLNPAEPDEQQQQQSYNSYSTQDNDNVDWYEDRNQNWRRYSAPNLISDSSSTSTNNNKKDLTIISYCNENGSSQSMPTSPMSKHPNISSTPDSNDDKGPRSAASSVPSSRRSSMNRSGQPVTQNGNSSMIATPPQTPGIKSPTKPSFSFPPAVTSCDQIMPPKVKRKRITQEQLQDLVAMFEQTDTPSYDVRERLAKKLNMTNREVQVWFQNRRAKANRAKANEHNASHQHHRFLHHHSVSTAQAASGHASSINNMMPHGNFTFVPMFTNGSPSAGGSVRGRSNRRHSYVSPPTNNNQKKVSQNTITRPRASTVTGAPMSSHARQHSIQQSSSQKFPPPIKILSYEHHLHNVHHPGGYGGYGHSVPPSPISPMTPMTPISPSPQTPTLPPINFMLSGVNNLTLPPPVPQIKDLLVSSSDYQQSAYHHHQQQQQQHSSHNQQQNMLPSIQSGYSDLTKSGEPSPIDLLATAAELVQSEEKEKERLRALATNEENNDENDKKSWRNVVLI